MKASLKVDIRNSNRLQQEICSSVCGNASGYVVVHSPELGDFGSCTHWERCPAGTTLYGRGHTHHFGVTQWPTGYYDAPIGGVTEYLGLANGSILVWLPGRPGPEWLVGPFPSPSPSVWP
jgi:hypothetical protein